MPRVLNNRKLKWKIPEGAVYVGRPSKWGNPFEIGEYGDRLEVIARYKAWLETPAGLHIVAQAKKELRGMDLVCWCAPLPCHADYLLELANE